MSSWTSRVLKTSKTVVCGLLILTVLWFLYRIARRMITKALGAKPAAITAPEFAPTDAVTFAPKPFSVTSVDSDKTIDAILSGHFGPCVVMFYADWCTHCKNMMDAYEGAASLSRVPFVKVQGQQAPVSSQKHGVTGYPTLFGVSAIPGPPRRFASMRTKESLLEFANALAPMQAHGAAPLAPLAPSAAIAHATVQADAAGPTGQIAGIPPSVTLTE